MRKPGDQISRYIVESVLGSGGMGDVYEALDTRLERKIALKLVRSEGKQAHAQRLLREARAIAAFEHPNAVVIYDVGETEGEMFIAMELVRGRPLRHFIGDASIALGRKLRWLVDAARALGAAHRAGLIHRDVKPDNIMVRNDGVVKVLDFGIARLASGHAQKNALGDSATVTAEGTLIGTPRYLAPEQLRGEDLDGRTDEFAWAVTAYELLTGEAPFSGESSVALLSKILTSTPKSLALPDAPPALEQALFRAMAKRPEERFESIDDAADALEAFADAPTDRNRIPKESPSLPGLSPANTAPDPSSKVCCDPEPSRLSPSDLGSAGTRKSKGQKRIIWLAAGAALLALGAGTFYATRPSKPLQSQATASEIAPAALIVSSLGCEPSVIEGGQPVADLDRVIGYAACGRLAIELGVSFGREKPSHKLSVRTRLSDSGAELTLGVGDKTVTAKAKTPLEAIVEAIPKLTSQLAPAPLTPEEIARWGAKDAEGARRIRKTWLRMILDYEIDDQAAVRELLRTDPDSARTHMLAIVAEVGTAENQKTHAARVRELLEKLPPAQANYMRNALHNRGFPDPANPSPKEPVSMRKAFTEDPQDTVLMTMLTVESLQHNAKEEGYALQDRLWKQSPAEAAWSMHFMCTWTPEQRDFEREAKYLELAFQYIPEVLTWDLAISHYFHTNQLPKARHSIQLGLQLGLSSGASGSFYFDTGRAWLELATWSPKEAREIANWMMGIPRPMVSTWGANVLAASYFFEGRIIDGMNLMARRLDAEDEANAKNNRLSVMIASDLMQRLWLPLPLPSKERLERMRFSATTDEGHGLSELNNLYMELLRIHNDPKQPKQKAEQYLKEVEAHLASMTDLAPEKRAQFALWTLPAIRRLKGNEEAIKLWLASQTAPFGSRRAMALEAGLAFLGVGKVEEAEAALKLAEDPHRIEFQSLSAIIARIRRGALYRSQKRIAEAEALEKQIGELWTNADPGMREYFEKLK